MIGYINRYWEELRDHLFKMKKKPVNFDFESEKGDERKYSQTTIIKELPDYWA